MSRRFHKKDKDVNSSASPSILTRLNLFILAMIHFVCPLLFFTNLTRNPYYTQIALLNLGIALCGFIWAIQTWQRGTWKFPRVSFDVPLIAFLVVALISTVLSWIYHQPLREGIQYEGTRIWAFTLVNSVMAFYLPLVLSKPMGEDSPDLSIWSDILFCVFWGAMWFGFHTMKNPDPKSLIWDPYGFFLWVIAFVYTVLRIKDGHILRIYHVVFSVAMLAGGYGLMQYMGRDLIWSSLVQPYGGRPVSTFGNPNFLSSYLLIVSPIALVLGLKAKGKQAGGYYLVSLICVLSALGTLTRSTYVGLFASFIFLAILLYKKEHLVYVKWAAVATGIVFVLILVFPATPVTSVQSPLARFTEIYDAIQSGTPYRPWHQRILIWSSAWDMVLERPLFGKGWGCFELFYPFYQGKLMLTELFAQFRTHANNAHNVLLEVWSQIGTVGTGMAIWLLVTLFCGGWVIFRRKEDGLSRFLVAGLLAGFVGMLTDNFFGNVSIFFAVPAFLFWWNMGALYNESDQLVLQERPVSPVWGRALLVLFMAFCLIVMVYFVKRWNQEFYYFKGFKAAKRGQVEKSVKDLEKAFQWFKGEVNTNYELGNSYSRYGKILEDKKLKTQGKKYKIKATEAYEAALRANPGYDEIYFNLGVTYAQMGEAEKSLEKLETAVFINPLLRDAYASIGNLHVQSNNLEKAGAIFEKGLEVYPRDKDIWLNLGFIYIKLGQQSPSQETDEKAYHAFKQAFSIDPNFKQAWNNLNLISKKLGRTEPLLDVPVLIQKMEQLVKSKKFFEAKEVAQKIVNLIPENADAHLSLGNILFYINQREEAIQETKLALKLNPNLSTGRINLGNMYKIMEQYDLAREQYQTVLKYDKNNGLAKKALESLP